jgi:hypothetical protein
VVAVLYVITRAPQVGALLVVGGVVGLILQSGMPLAWGLWLMAVAALGAMAVGLACALPYLPDQPVARGSAPPIR